MSDLDQKAKAIMSDASLNKGCGFSEQERRDLGLLGRLPYRVESLEEQMQRHYLQYQAFATAMEKNIYLNVLLNTNETLFYALVAAHIEEMLPIIYTPTVGEAVQAYSLQFRRERGRYVSYPHHGAMAAMLGNTVNEDIDVLVITDGAAILGIGDQGVGGMAISVGKSIVYALCAGISPERVLPIQLDVGTDNQALLDDPSYLGWRHNRVKGDDYLAFMDNFVKEARRLYPNAMLHWEDFDRDNAGVILKRYQDQGCTFNDDMQGTGAVTLAAIFAALDKGQLGPLSEQRIVIHGAGAAALGIADQLVDAMVEEGVSVDEARSRFWLLNSRGLLTESMERLSDEQRCYVQPDTMHASWPHAKQLDLETVVANVKPTVLIGCSTVKGAFSQAVVETMASNVDRPVILPLSNPSSKSEADPQDLMQWTKGRALVATGSPFPLVTLEGKSVAIAQCNNAFIYPGLGLGLVVSKAKKLDTAVLLTASRALAQYAKDHPDDSRLLPPIDVFPEFAKSIALSVAQEVAEQGHAGYDGDYQAAIDQQCWSPKYE